MTREFKNWLETKKELFSTDFCVWYYKESLPLITWGEKVYVISENKLTAIIPIEAVLLREAKLTDNLCYENPHWYIHFKVAGIGDKFMSLNNFIALYNGYFECVDDYKQFLNGDTFLKKSWAYDGDKYDYDRIEKHIGRTLGLNHIKTENTWNHGIFAYTCPKGGLKADTDLIKITEMSVSENGVKIDTNWESRYGKRVYRSAEEAIRENAVSEVVDFDEPKNELTRAEKLDAIDDRVDFEGGVYVLDSEFTAVNNNGVNLDIVAVGRLAEGVEGWKLVAFESDFTNWDIDDYFDDYVIDCLYDEIVGEE